MDLGIQNLDIYITGKCNYKCGYCYGENDKKPEMLIETYLRCLDFARYIDCSNIELCGGEPLLCSNFEKFVTLAKKNHFSVILRTNGILGLKKIDFIANNCSWVGISIDGLEDENALMRESKTHISKKEQFEIPIKVIKELKEKNNNINILLASVLSAQNYKNFLKFAEYIEKEKLPIDKWKIYQFVCDKFRSLSNKDLYRLNDEMFNKICSLIPKKINNADVIFQSSKGLDSATNCLIVRQNGDIILSNVFYGNVVKDSHERIVQNLKKNDAIALIVNNKNKTYNVKKNNENCRG